LLVSDPCRGSHGVQMIAREYVCKRILQRNSHIPLNAFHIQRAREQSGRNVRGRAKRKKREKGRQKRERERAERGKRGKGREEKGKGRGRAREI